MVQLSIIVPATGTQQALDDTLVSVLEHRPPDCEIVVPHPAAYHDPYDLEDEVTFVSVPSESADSVTLINQGLGWARGRYIHVLLPGVEVTEGWAEIALQRFEDDPQLSAVAPALVHRDKPTRLIAAGVRYRIGGARHEVAAGRALRRVARHGAAIAAPLLRAGFYRRSTLLARQGFHFAEPWADAELAASWQNGAGRCAFEPDCILTARPEKAPGGMRVGRQAEQLFWRYARRHGVIRSLLAHTVHVPLDCACRLTNGSTATLLGRSLGWIDAARGRHRATVENKPGGAAEAADERQRHILPFRQPAADEKPVSHVTRRTGTDG